MISGEHRRHSVTAKKLMTRFLPKFKKYPPTKFLTTTNLWDRKVSVVLNYCMGNGIIIAIKKRKRYVRMRL